MIHLTPMQAKNLLDNLDRVTPTYGHPTVLNLFERMVCDRTSAARLETILIYLAAGNDIHATLHDGIYPPVARILDNLRIAGIETLAHSNLHLTHYRIDRALLLRQLGIALHVSDDSAHCLLARPQDLFYKDYMLSPQWEVKRAAAVKRAGNRCQKCGAAGRLEVHHLVYIRMGQERPEDLVVVCPTCHAELDKRSGSGKGRKAVKHG